jgi:hypothetical protein
MRIIVITSNISICILYYMICVKRYSISIYIMENGFHPLIRNKRPPHIKDFKEAMKYLTITKPLFGRNQKL